jgi:type I restriction enzyme S subunit
MKSNFDVLGNHIVQVDYRNTDMVADRVLGISIDKFFMPSVANVIGTDLSRYKLISKGLFACNPMHVGRDERLPVSLYTEDEPAIVSPAYFMFKIKDEAVLDREYLMMWFRRPEFDRICWLRTDGSVRGGITWEDLCRIELPVPSMEQQKEVVESYKAITKRIELKKQINDNLEASLSLLFNQSFCSLSFDIKEGYSLSQLMRFDNGYAFSSADYLPQGKYKIITIGNVADGFLDTSSVNYINDVPSKVLQNCLLNIGDIVISLTGNVGRTALIKEENLLLNQRVARIVPNKHCYLPFLYCLFRQEKTKNYLIGISKGTAQANLSPIELLKTIVDYDFCEIEEFSRRASAIIDAIIRCSKEISHLLELADTYLSTLSR